MRRVRAQVVFESSNAGFDGETMTSEGLYSADFLPCEKESVDSWRYQYVKRGFDVLWALMMIVFFAIPGLMIAAAVLLTSEGPVFYREERIGQDGRPFKIFKFRSMYRNAPRLVHIEDGQPEGTVLQWRMRKDLRDPRITVVGGFLRRWSLDELPQLFNIFRGEMSFIGPRPIVVAETPFYGDLITYYLAARPGLSGLWQVSGRSNVDYSVRARLDALYVRSWSLAADLNILLRTVPAVLCRIGAC